MKDGRTFEFVCEETIVATKTRPASPPLKEFVEYHMLQVRLDPELLIIGTFKNLDGKKVQHASTFIYIECAPSKEAVVVHLDSNADYPQCTKPGLLKNYGHIDNLLWNQFDRNSQILVYSLSTVHLFTDAEKVDKLKMIKEAVEGPPPAPPVSAS